MNYLIFGTGEYYQRYKKWIRKEDILALLDNAPEKQGKEIDGIRVISPEEGSALPFDAVIIMSFYIKAMKQQLLKVGVAEEKIFHFYDLRKLTDPAKQQKEILYDGLNEAQLKELAGKRIALLSTDLAFGGTAIALFHLAKALQKNGYPVIFASMIDGPLRETLRQCGIPVIVDSNLQLATMKETAWLAGFRMVVCNAINYYLFLSERNTEIPVIWWLHDSEFFYDGVDRDILRGIVRDNLKVFAVGPVPAKAIHAIDPDVSVRTFLYGIEDTAGEDPVQKEKDAPLCFVTIGAVEERKGQDILIRAIGLLKKEIRKKALFYIVGKNTSLMAGLIAEAAKEFPEVILTGAVDRRKIDEILRCADVMICPSREDPMPTVAAEAMMYRVPCILSDAAGTAAYITEKENGILFASEDVEELSEKVAWCVNNRDLLGVMGERAREIYESRFSMQVFEKKLLEIVDEV